MNGRNERDASAAAREAAVLRQRAQQLACPPAATDGALEASEALEFSIADQRCLLALEWVREVRAPVDQVPVPLAAEPLVGLAQLRGRMLPVLDVRTLLGIAPPASAGAPHLVVLGRELPVLCIAASAVHGLQRLAAADAERRSAPLESVRPDLVRGVTADGHLVLDGERLLDLQRGARSVNPFPPELERQERP